MFESYIIPLINLVPIFWMEWRSLKSLLKARNLTIKALQIFQKYARRNHLCCAAENEFHVTFSELEKNIVIYPLQKLGIPIICPYNDVSSIRFEEKKLDGTDIEVMITQVKQGLCDCYFTRIP